MLVIGKPAPGRRPLAMETVFLPRRFRKAALPRELSRSPCPAAASRVSCTPIRIHIMTTMEKIHASVPKVWALMCLLWLAWLAAACGRPAPEEAMARPLGAALTIKAPRGLPPLASAPVTAQPTAEAVALGRRLFYDSRLSGNGTFSCASCHRQARAFTDGRAHALGSTGQAHPRSAMSLTNVAYNSSYGWADGRIRTLEAQMAVPMFNEHPIEMGLKGNEAAIVSRYAGNLARGSQLPGRLRCVCVCVAPEQVREEPPLPRR